MIDKERLKVCIDVLAHILKQGDEKTVMLGETEFQKDELVNFIAKWFYKAMIQDEEKTQDYLDFIIESIHFFTCLSNDSPKLNILTPQELERIQSKYHEKAKFVIKTK